VEISEDHAAQAAARHHGKPLMTCAPVFPTCAALLVTNEDFGY